SPPGVALAIWHAERERTVGSQQPCGRAERASRIRQLVEGVPDRHGVERTIGRTKALEVTVVDDEAERSHECVHVRIDVESLELPARLARRREKGAHVTAHLESSAAARELPGETPCLRAE